MYSQTHRKTRFFTAAAFSVLFMMLFAFIIPSVKASADQSFTAPCTGRTIPYSKSGVTYVSSSGFVTAKCNGVSGGVSQFTITVSPNTTTYSRSATLYAKKGVNGATVEKIYITQSPVQTKSYSVSYMGGTYTSPLNCSYVSNNTAVCNSGSGSTFYVKPNTTTSQRKCTLSLKTGAGIVYYLYITQAPVPLITKSIAGGGGTFSRSYSYSASLTPNKANMINVSSSGPSSGTYTYNISVSANPSSSATRTTDITVKTSSGIYLEIIRVTQSRFVVPTKTIPCNSDPQLVTLECPGATFNKTTYSNTAMFKTGTSLGNGKYQFKLPQNESYTATRSNTVTFRDQYGTPIAQYTVKQDKVPLYETEVDDGCPTIEFYNKSGVETFIYDTKYVTNVSRIGNGKFVITITANPSTTQSRTFNIIAQNKSGAYVEVIRLTQPQHEHYYTYKLSGHVLSRICLYCNSIKDKDVSYKEYISYGGLADNVDHVKAYLIKIGYAEGTKEYNDLVKGYEYINKTKNRNFLQNCASKAESFNNKMDKLNSLLISVGDYTMNDKQYSRTVALFTIASDLYNFFTKQDTAGKLSATISLAGDLVGLGLDNISSGYLSASLSALGKAIEKNLPAAFNYEYKKFHANMLAYDLEHNSFFERLAPWDPTNTTTVGAVKKAIKAACPEVANSGKKTDDYAEKLLQWKKAYEGQKVQNEIYSMLGESITIRTDIFMHYVGDCLSNT